MNDLFSEINKFLNIIFKLQRIYFEEELFRFPLS